MKFLCYKNHLSNLFDSVVDLINRGKNLILFHLRFLSKSNSKAFDYLKMIIPFVIFLLDSQIQTHSVSCFEIRLQLLIVLINIYSR